jgi:FSR family fosmidomycin resistance protein-like MFS transporter
MTSTSTTSTTPTTLPTEETSDRFETGGVVTVSAAHMVHDTYTAFLSPLLPLLIENHGLTKTAAAMLSVFYQVPSLLQPLVGHLGDRIDLKILVILSPTVAAAMMTLLGVAPTYAVLALLLIVAGVNSAGLHSIGPVIAGHLSGRSLGRGMSYWMVGGELARTAGPLILVGAVSLLTPRGLPWLIFGGLAASALLWLRLRRESDYRPPGYALLGWGEALRRIRPILFPVAAVITFRALLFSGLVTFLPTYLTENGASFRLAGASLSVMEAAGVAGALFSGVLSDRIGRRKIMLVMTLAAPLAMLLFLNTGGWLQIAVLLLVGLTMLATTPVLMALVLERARETRALANGIYMALNFVITSLATIGVGRMGDVFGLHTSLTVAAVVMLVGVPFVLLLPEPEK